MHKLKDGTVLDVEEISWEKGRLLLQPLTPELVAIIDEIAPDADFPLFKAKYPFGVKIIDRTNAFLPLKDGGLVSFNDSLLPAAISKHLSYDPYRSNPVGIVIDKNSEFYLSVGNVILPYMLVKPGEMFGSNRILDHMNAGGPGFHISFFLWEMTSGARSIFMLPKVTENISHNKLRKTFGLSQSRPNSYQDHWHIFRDLAHKKKVNWQSEFLFFSKKWFERLRDPAWMKLYCYLLWQNRQSYEFWRNSLSWEISFSAIEQSKNLRFSAYTLDTAKHLFAIAAGAVPGFKPATDESAAPIQTLQECYVQGYGLHNYWPVIMEPGHYSLSEKLPVYYSLSYPTLAQNDSQTFKGKSIIALLDEIQIVVDKYRDGIRNDSLASTTSLYKTAEMMDVQYYHHDPATYQGIKDSALLAAEDKRFAHCPQNGGEFPKYGSFLKGCIKLTPK